MFAKANKSDLAAHVILSLDDVDKDEWNQLNRGNSPFLRYEFLIAMERHQAVGQKFGWLPRFVVVHDPKGHLVGAMPLYEKDNSYGELVFDWAWANAYHRQGMQYYPKLVSAIPYTPATGDRLLTIDSSYEIQSCLITCAIEYCESQNYSSLHCLFPSEIQLPALKAAGLQQRVDVQYHWFNDDYSSFEDYLSGMRNSKRKKIKQERRRVAQEGIDFIVMTGNELSDDQWAWAHHFYSSTFYRKSGYATFSLDFFKDVGKTMGEQMMVVFAMKSEQYIAAAINYCSDNVLYGRHWGCDEEIPGLHFETCYYQGIEYAIKQGIERFEPGAQGEYKMSRGFMPALTYSGHWIVDNTFRRAINGFLIREEHAVRDYQQTLLENAPFKSDHPVYARFQPPEPEEN